MEVQAAKQTSKRQRQDTTPAAATASEAQTEGIIAMVRVWAGPGRTIDEATALLTAISAAMLGR